MARLRGITDSKTRRVTYERNRNLAAPTEPLLSGHNPTPRADGSLACSGCGTTRYSPAAFAAHLAGRPVRDAEFGVFTLGVTDPWSAAQIPERQQQEAERAGAKMRAAQVETYYADRSRAKPRVVDGGNGSVFFD